MTLPLLVPRVLVPALACLIAAVAPAAAQEKVADATPTLRRVLVQADALDAFVPADAALRVLPIAEFEQLATRLEAASRRVGAPAAATATIVRATHRARLEGARLVGATELRLDRPPGQAAAVALAPWNLAILPDDREPTPLRTTPEGLTFVVVGPDAPDLVRCRWSAPTLGREGRFHLELPNLTPATLELELPEGLVPRSSAGLPVGPTPDPMSGTWRWSWPSAAGAVDLTLDAMDGSKAAQVSPRRRHKLSGDTRLSLGVGAGRWAADWRVDAAGTEPLLVDMPPTLQVASVGGSAVREYRTLRRPDGSTRLEIRLARGSDAEPILHIEAAHAASPIGRREIPFPTLVGALWGGGRAVVELGGDVRVRSIEAGAGLRVAPTAAERAAAPAGTTLVAFESTGPTSPGVLDLDVRSDPGRSELRGLLDVDATSARFTARLVWRFAAAPPSELSVDLGDGWCVDQVRLDTLDEPTRWVDRGQTPDGRSRVSLRVPESAGAQGTISAVVRGRRTVARDGPIEPPHLGLPDVEAPDTTWALLLADGLRARPVAARDIAWMDAEEATSGVPPIQPGRAAVVGWRATGPAPRAAFQVEPEPPAARIDAWVVVRLRPGSRQVSWLVRLDGGPGPKPLTLREGASAPPEVRWTTAGRDVASSADADEDGRVVRLDLPADLPTRDRFTLRATPSEPGGDAAAIPLFWVESASEPTPTAVLVLCETGLVPTLEAREVDRIDPAAALARFRAAAGEDARDLLAESRPVGVFLAHPGRGAITARAVVLPEVGGAALIAEATLVSRPAGAEASLHVLDLAIRGDGRRPVELTPRPGCTLLGAALDGRPFDLPSRSGRLILPVEPTTGTDGPTRIEVRYLGGPLRGGATRHAFWPELSVPTLLERWIIEPPGPGQFLGEPAPTSTRPPRPTRGDVAAVRDRLDQRFRDAWSEGLDVASVLLRMDRADLPLIVDPDALWTAATIRVGASTSAARPTPLTSWTAWLAERGLAVVPAPPGAFITSTTRADSLSRDPDAISRLIETARRGDDPLGRWMTTGAWATRPSTPAGPESVAPGTWSGARLGLDGSNTRLAARDPAGDRIVAAIAAGLALALVVAPGWPSRRARLRLLGAATLLAVILAPAGVSRTAPVRDGLALACGLVALVALARWLPVRRKQSGAASRRRPGIVRSAALLLGASALAGLGAAAGPEETPILVFLPYDAQAGPTSAPDRAILRLDDYERIERWCRVAEAPNRPTDAGLPFGATSASHQIAPAEPEILVLTSRYELVAPNGGDRSWTFPITGAVLIEATLDGRHETVDVVAGSGGVVGSVSVHGAGLHRLEVRMQFRGAAERGPWIVPLPSVAVSELQVDPALACDAPGGPGPIGPPTSLRAWKPGTPAEAGAPSGPISYLALWDLAPAGDTLRLRIDSTAGAPEPVVVELAGEWSLEPGAPAEARAAVVGEGTKAVTRIEAGPVPVAPLELALWRPAMASLPGPRFERPDPAPRFPGRAAVQGLRAVRLVAPLSSAEAVPTARPDVAAAVEAFRKAWGESLAAGAGNRPIHDVRPHDEATPSPVAVRRPGGRPPEIEVTALARVGPGRLDLRAEALASSPDGPLEQLRVGVPAGLRVERIEAEGLTDFWTDSESGDLILRFDALDRTTSRVVVSGWLAAASRLDTSGAAPTTTLDVPWPTWGEARVGPGLLDIAAPAGTAVQLAPTPGVTAEFRAGPSAADVRLRFRVEPAARPGSLTWTPADPPADVRVASHLAMLGDRVTWHATARYAVDRGPITHLVVELPAAWADTTAWQVDGRPVEAVLTREGNRVRAEVHLPEPAWGHATLALRAVRPAPEGPLAYPDLTPLGLGRAETYVAWSDLSGRGLVAEGSSGVQPVAASRLAPPPGPAVLAHDPRVYHVLRNGWSLRLRTPSGTTPAPAVGGEVAAVSLTRIEFAAARDGALAGATTCEVRPGDLGASVRFRVPEDVEVIAATRDGRWAPVLGRGTNQVEVPIAPGQIRDVALLWRRHPAAKPSPGPLALVLPRPEQVGVPLVVMAATPESWSLTWPRPLAATSAARQVVLRLAARQVRLAALATGIDRSSERDRAALIAEVVEFELLARAGARLIALPTEPGAEALDPREVVAPGELDAARAAVDELLRADGLDTERTEARRIVGLDREPPARPAAWALRRATPPHVPLIGSVWRARGVLPASDLVVEIRPAAPPVAEPTTLDEARAAAPALLLAAWLLAATRRRRPDRS